MNKQKIVISIILFSIVISCSKEKNKLNIPTTAHRYHYYKKDSIVESNKLLLDRIMSNDSIIYIYRFENNSDEFMNVFKQLKNSNKTMLIGDIQCPLIEEKNYIIDNHKFEVLKYDYNKPSSSDEETSYYFCKDYGLLIENNYSFYGLVYTFEYDFVSQKLVNQILTDSADFRY